MHSNEKLVSALCVALDLTEIDLENATDLDGLVRERRRALAAAAMSDARATIEWQRRRVSEAMAVLADIGAAPIAPGAHGLESGEGERMTEAEVVALLQYPIRWIRYADRFVRSGKGKSAIYQRAEVLAYKHERDASGWLTLDEAEERLAFPHLHPAECARTIPAVKMRGQLRFPRLEVERERERRAAESAREEALGPEGRRVRDERVRAEVRRTMERMGLYTTKGGRR